MQIKTIRYHLSPIRMAIIKKMTITNVGENTEKGDTRALLVGMSIAAATMKNSTDFGKCSPPQIKDRTITQSCNSISGYFSDERQTPILKDICSPMLIATLVPTAKIWKQPKCPSIDEWIKKRWYICTMEYYSTITKNKILCFATSWMDLGGTVLSDQN